MEATTAGVSPEAEHAHFEAPSGVVARIQHVLHTRPVLSPIAVLVLTSIVFTIFGKGNFQGSVNIGNTLQQTMPVAILAIGQTLVILTAGIDLSVGTAMLLAHMIVAKSAVDSGLNPVMCLLLGLLAGVAMGALNGILVTRVKLPPFIVTLGTFFVFTSIGLIYAEARTIRSDDMPSLLSWTGRTFKIGSIQLSYNVVLVLLMYVLFSFILSNTSWGRHVYAIGDDPEASRLAGINVTRVQLSVYIVAGLIYGIGAWVQIGRAGSASTNGATDANLDTITAVVVGGTSLFGGRGLLWGSLVGAIIVQVVSNGLSLAGVDPNWRNFGIGCLILVAVALDQWIRKLRK